MKKQILKSIAMIAMAIATTTSFSYAQQKEKEKKEVNHHVGEPGKGPHGGTIQEADPYHAEIGMKDGKVMLFLLTDEAKLMSNAGVTGTATFLMPDGKTIKASLTASGDDGFVVTNAEVISYKSCVVSFSVKGKTVTVKFKNQSAGTKTKQEHHH